MPARQFDRDSRFDAALGADRIPVPPGGVQRPAGAQRTPVERAACRMGPTRHRAPIASRRGRIVTSGRAETAREHRRRRCARARQRPPHAVGVRDEQWRRLVAVLREKGGTPAIVGVGHERSGREPGRLAARRPPARRPRDRRRPGVITQGVGAADRSPARVSWSLLSTMGSQARGRIVPTGGTAWTLAAPRRAQRSSGIGVGSIPAERSARSPGSVTPGRPAAGSGIVNRSYPSAV